MANIKSSRAAELAARITDTARNTLLIKLRFMDTAIFRLFAIPEKTTLAVDGKNIYYGIEHILKLYKKEPNAVNRAFLHMIFHCIFRHMFVGATVNRPFWNLACDIAVENIISSLGLNCTHCADDGNKNSIIAGIAKETNLMNAEKIYRVLLDRKLSENEFCQLQAVFMTDDHACWYNPNEFTNSASDGEGNGDSDSKNSNGNDSSDSENGDFVSSKIDTSVAEEWENVSKQIEIDLETFSAQQGLSAGNMIQQLKELNREKYDYSVFLKKFAVMGETMRVNDDEFDYIFYTYGLKLFKNIPLIEPLEYKEEKRIRDFVIAIDTSGSTSGEIVQKFLNKTYNILKNSESYFSKVNIWIVQCDAKIQEAKKIASQEEFDEYIRNFQIKGLGGTDFRPVFDFVNKLVDDKEFTKLKGMIYFTDGFGTFPQKKPDYETAFVFLQNEYNNLDVPPWAIKLILNSDEI